MTVTATQTANGANGILLRIVVLTQAKLLASQTGGTAGNNYAAGAANASVTTTQTGSRVYGAIVGGNQTFTPNGNTTTIDSVADATNGENYTTIKGTSLTGTPGATSFGGTYPTTNGSQAYVEVLTAGTLTEDASGGVNSTTSAQNVQLTINPPPGSLLVALVSSDGGTGTTTVSVTDNLGTSLNWTQKAVGNGNSNDYAGVWLADVPASPSITSANPGLTWRRHFKHPQQQLGGAVSAGSPVSISGVVANVNVNSQFTDETPAIYQTFNPGNQTLPYSFFPWFGPGGNKPHIQQQSTALPNVFVPGSAGNVNVAGPAGTVTELIDGVGQTANVNAVAQPGTINIYQTFVPQAPFPEILPSALQFKPAYEALRVQYSTALPDVFVPGSSSSVTVAAPAGTVNVLVDGAGSAANVNVATPAGTISIYQNFNPPFPYSPVLPAQLGFNPPYLTLRQQYNTATPLAIGGIPGTTANVNVSGQADNSVSDILTGTTSNVNVTAVAGSINIYQNFNPVFPVPVLLNSSIRFNNSFIALRQQYGTALPSVFEVGAAASVVVSAQSGSVLELIDGTGQAANVNIASSGATVVSISGVVVNVSVAANAGTLSVTISGSTGLVNTVAQPGSPGSGSVAIAGVTAVAFVGAIPGGFLITNPFNPFWWRVYRGYGQSPVW